MAFVMPTEPFTTAEALSRGLTSSDLRALVRDGEVRRVLRGVFVPTGLEDTFDLRIRSVAKVVTPGHVAIDRTAAWIHGIDVLTSSEITRLPRVETAAPPDLRVTDRSGVLGRRRMLIGTDIMTVGTVRVTTPLRTALDLGGSLRRREAYAALNEFARIHGLDPLQLRGELPRFRRRRGVVQLRELIELMDASIESVRESWTLLAVVDAGLPRPEAQIWVEVEGIPTYRLDFGWRAQRVAVEYDGVADHLRTDEQRVRDARRREHLARLGWTVIVVRIGDFHGPRLEQWIGELRGALRQPAYTPLRFRPTA